MDPNVTAPTTAGDYAPPTDPHPDPLDSASPLAPAGGLWTVGTLTYTTAGLILLFAVLLGGDFALSMRERAIGPMITKLVKRLTESDVVLAVLMSTLPTALTLLILPAISYRSDRHRGRWGRRLPYLLIPTPLAAVSMALLAYTEDFGRLLHGVSPGVSAHAVSLGCFAVLWTVFECAAIIAVPMFGALINDVVPRPVLGRFFGMFRAISLIAGMIFNFVIFKHAEVYFKPILICIAGVFFAGVTAMCFLVREGDYPAPTPEPPERKWYSTWTRSFVYVRACFGVRYYRWIFAGVTLAALTFQPVNLFSYPYAKSLKLSDGDIGFLTGLTYTISLCLAWPLGWLVDKAHALRCSLWVLAAYAASMVLAGVMVHDRASFGVFFVIHGVISGCYFTTSSPLGQVLYPRLTYARYASAAVLVQSVVTLGFGLAVGGVLNLTAHAYGLTFWMGAGLSTAALLSLIVVQSYFNRLGGREGYVPPEAADEGMATAESVTDGRGFPEGTK